MVQGNKKLGHADTLRGKTHQKGTAATVRRAAPKESKYIDAHSHKTTAAIKKRIESLMAGRLAHEGGTLVVVPRPAAVDTYDKARPRTGATQNKAIFAASMARRARMKQAGVNLPELGAHLDEEERAPAEQKGKKRKRGLHGIYRHGDDWFNEEDAALEAIKYESDASDIDDDDDTPAPQEPPTKDPSLDVSMNESVDQSVDGEVDESDDGDFDLDDFEECSDDEDDDDEEDEDDESAVETSVSKQSNKQSNKQSSKQSTKPAPKQPSKSAVKPAAAPSKPAAAKSVIGSIGGKKDASHAAKRGKALLGGWFGKKK